MEFEGNSMSGFLRKLESVSIAAAGEAGTRGTVVAAAELDQKQVPRLPGVIWWHPR